MSDERSPFREPYDPARTRRHLELSELLNRVLDRGVMIMGDVTISVADVDLVRLTLGVAISSVETQEGRRKGSDADVPVLPPETGR